MSTIASASTVVAKKRKASQDSSISAERPLRKDSEAAASSQASEDTTTIALRTLLDGSVASSAKTTSTGPPKKRKTSFDKETVFAGSASSSQEGPLRKRKLSHDAPSRPRFSSIGSVDDAALGLAPIGSASESHASEDHHAKLPASEHAAAVLDHLEALGDESASIGAHKPKAAETDSHSSGNVTMTSGNQRLLMEALMMGGSNRRRDRFESWGGMSDISLHMGSSDQYNSFMDGAAAAAAIAASALQSTIDEVNLSIALPHGASCQASVTSSVSGDHDRPVPSRISLNRDRKHSLASLSEGSSGFHQFTYGPSSEITPDIQAFVAAAMATVGDQLAELAGVVETCAEGGSSVNSETMKDHHDDHSIHSAASSLTEIRHQGRERSFSTSSNPIAVDIDAVAAAVNAAEAATGALDLAHFASVSSVSSPSRSGGSRRASERAATVRKPSTMNLLPAILPIPPLPPSTKSERDMEAIRARARAAAGYVPPSNLKPGEIPQPQPVKKRPRPLPKSTAHPPKAAPSHCVPDHAYSMYNATNKASAQKWDEMYECLLRFVEERRKVETKGMTEKEKKDWGWDGNVPTTYKAKDGKALGRWINNQRSAKHKGSLKKDREVKLLRTGLKWSVLSTNTWQDMMDELRLYVEEKTKGSGQWDGNVPTNYKIKGSRDENGEEKNLGRWINRQRSLYQSGKLRKDREIQLERLGLKWSVLSTTSWDAMYDTLLEYIEERKDLEGTWDGNVPANYRTEDHPPKALGRWINRQRTAHQKSKLKKEFVDKLNAVGLKWSIHERRPIVSAHTTPTPVKSNLSNTISRPAATGDAITTNGHEAAVKPEPDKSSETSTINSSATSASSSTASASRMDRPTDAGTETSVPCSSALATG